MHIMENIWLPFIILFYNFWCQNMQQITTGTARITINAAGCISNITNSYARGTQIWCSEKLIYVLEL